MSNAYLKNAFRMLDALNEDIFDVSDEGISQLADTLNTEDNTVNIIDPEAESEEDLQDSYMDKVILECEVCHSLIYKNKDEIKIDDESQLANIDEECPYCFSTNGYKIVGQVAPFKEESDKEDIEVEVDGEDVDIKSEEDNEDLDESLKKRSRNLNEDFIFSNDDFNFNRSYKYTGKVFFDNLKDPNHYAVDKNDLYSNLFDFDIKEDTSLDSKIREAIEKVNYNIYIDDEDDHKYNYDDDDDNNYDDNYDDDDDNGSSGYISIEIITNRFLDKKEIDKLEKFYAEAGNESYFTGILDDLVLKSSNNEEEQIVNDIYTMLHKSLQKFNETFIKASGLKGGTTPSGWKNIQNGNVNIGYYFNIEYKGHKLIFDKYKLPIPVDDFYSNPAKYANQIYNELKDEALKKIKQVDSPSWDENLENDWASNGFDFERETPFIYNFPNSIEAHKALKIAKENGYVDSWDDWKSIYLDGKKEESLKEGFNDVQISTDDQHLTMTQDSETGKVTVETEPIQKEESFESEDMMIAPLNNEEEQEIEDSSDQLKAEEDEEESEEVSEDETSEESEDEESEEVDVADFEESLFNNLGQKYLTEVYDNIESFNTSKVYQDNKNNKLIIEGVIKFNSGNSKKTSFIFEAKDIDKDRKVRFVGENQQITKGKKSFTLRGTLKDGTLLSESLTYNYRTRDNDGESIRLYNTIKVDK